MLYPYLAVKTIIKPEVELSDMTHTSIQMYMGLGLCIDASELSTKMHLASHTRL